MLLSLDGHVQQPNGGRSRSAQATSHTLLRKQLQALRLLWCCFRLMKEESVDVHGLLHCCVQPYSASKIS